LDSTTTSGLEKLTLGRLNSKITSIGLFNLSFLEP